MSNQPLTPFAPGHAWRWLRRLACAMAATLLGACTGVSELSASLTALEATPAEVTLAADGTATFRLSFGVEVSNADDGWSFGCSEVAGLPAGVSSTRRMNGLAVCGTGTAPSTFSGTLIVELSLQATPEAPPAPGRYTLRQPVKLTAKVDRDLTPGQVAVITREAELSFVLVVPGVPPAPPPEPPPPPAGPAAWQPLGEALNVDANSFTSGPALVVDGADRPLAAWVENERVVVRHWDGGAWQSLGAGPGGVAAQGKPALALDASGAPVVAWTEARTGSTSGALQVQARRWDGGAWQPMGTQPLNAADVPSAQDPALLRLGTDLLLAWAETSTSEGGERIAVRRWTGNAWADATVAGPLPAPGRPVRVALATVDGNTPAVAWQNDGDQRVRVATSQFGAWTLIGDFPGVNVQSFGFVHTPAHGLLLAIAPAIPVAQFTVLLRTGAGWAEFGSPQGLTANGARVQWLSLGVEAASGRPLLAWGQFTTSIRRFEVRRWSGSDWSAVGEALPPLGRSANGTPFGVAVSGGTRPVLATEVSTLVPSDLAIRVQEFR